MKFRNSRFLWQSPVVKLTAYVAGNVVGAPIPLGPLGGDSGRGRLMQICISDQDNQKAPLTILFFSAPLAGTYTDGSAPVLVADLPNLVCSVDIAAVNYDTIGGVAIATVEVKRTIIGDNLRLMYPVLVTTGTPTFTAVNHLTVGYAFEAD